MAGLESAGLPQNQAELNRPRLAELCARLNVLIDKLGADPDVEMMRITKEALGLGGVSDNANEKLQAYDGELKEADSVISFRRAHDLLGVLVAERDRK